MAINHVMKYSGILLDYVNKSRKQDKDFCPKCDQTRGATKLVFMCSKCGYQFLHLPLSERRKMISAGLKRPGRCPLCDKESSGFERRKKAFLCLKCNYTRLL